MRPSKRPKRLNISVTPEVHETIVRISELTETPISACVAEMLEELLPGLKHTLSLLEEASKLDSQAKNNLMKQLERHSDHLRQTVEYVQKNSEEDVKQHKLPLE